ncbi:MAG: glycosyltransferase family 4 protein [Bacteroidetes bacterium]|nr:glycosyltransferase family 4 protein [Bacteroidota bacterium]
MRIVFFVNHFLPSIGGVQWSALRTAEALSGRGHDVTVYTETPSTDGEDDEVWAFSLRRFTVPACRPLTRLWYWHFMWSQRAFLASADVLHFHDYTTFFHWFLPLRLLIRTPRYVVTFHGFEFWPVRKRHQVLREVTARLCHVRFAVGEYLRGIYTHPIDAVYLGAPVHSETRPQELRSNDDVSVAAPLTFAFVGRLEEDTGILSALLLLRNVAEQCRRSIRVCIAGDGVLRSGIEALDGDVLRIELYGKTPRPDLLLDQADMVIASGYLAVFDAWQRGLPVLAPAFTHLKRTYFESIPDMRHLLFLLDSEEHAKQLLTAILTGSMRKEIAMTAERARRFVSRLSWQDIAILLENWYLPADTVSAPRSQFCDTIDGTRNPGCQVGDLRG